MTTMKNLLDETLEVLQKNGKSAADVRWCGSIGFGWFSWDDFVWLANTEYSDGYYSCGVAEDLLVVGEDFWLERHDYDGRRWWEFKRLPQRPENYVKPIALTLEQAEQNDPEDTEHRQWEGTLKALNPKGGN